MTVICYKTKVPTIYNAGTKYQSQCDTFLAYYTYKAVAEAAAECEELNTNKPDQLWNGAPIDWTKIDYFYPDEQEPMED